MSGFTLYLILMLDNVRGIGFAASVLVGFIIAISIAVIITVHAFGDNEEINRFWDNILVKSKNTYFKITIIIVFLLLLLSITIYMFIPTTKQMAVILITPKIINNEKIKEIPEKIIKIGEKYLDELLEEKKEKLAK